MSLDLVGLWRFQPDLGDAGERLGYLLPTYDAHRWREVRVPADFETCHPALDTYEGAGWFRKQVRIPDTWRGQRVILRFAGINAHARVWVNGELVVTTEDPFLPFSADVTSVLEYGADNAIVVCVDNGRRPGDVPGVQRGWRNYGGILREVTLTATDLCHLDGIEVVAEPCGTSGHLDLTAVVVNERTTGLEAHLAARVFDESGQVLATLQSRPFLISVDERVRVTLSGDVPGVLPWSPKAPSLYRLEVELIVGGSTVDVALVRAGFRTIEVRSSQLWLNGEPVFLTGFNRHEDSPSCNMCADLDTARHDLLGMKAAGANFVRLCHYPHHPGELDLCDEIGLLVMAEIPLYWWEGREEGDMACTAKLEAAQRQLRTLIRRDRNHPSVIFWSVSNETHEERPEVAAGNAALVDLAKTLDPTRLAVHVSDHWRESASFAPDDVICVNGYPSVGALNRERESRDALADATAFWREELVTLHRRYPDKPILVTEFGYTSLHGVADSPQGGETHADVIEAEFLGMDAPYVCGATVWCWADHAWPPATFAFCGFLATSPYGVLTRDRRRKPAYWRVRSLFRARQGVAEVPTKVGLGETGPSGHEVYMIRDSMKDIPQVAFPEGFRVRTMRNDDGGLWTDIWRDAEEYLEVGPDLFWNQFGDDPEALTWRGFIVEDQRGIAVGTITAWYNRTYHGRDYGQIHWVAVRRASWGRGIGKAMMTHALNQMAQWHDRAFLGTQTKRLAAIKVYLDFGFVPDLAYAGAREAWLEVTAHLSHPALASIDLDLSAEENNRD
jgi:beta-glucuronidase